VRAGWHANNGCRIAHSSGWLSDESVNDDDTHGLGNEFGAGTNAGGKAQNIASSEWWHDASVDQADCHGTSCKVQGTDHGTSLNDGPMLGQYAIYTGTFDGLQPGESSHGRSGHFHARLYISLGMLHTKQTGRRENGFIARG
jgi:hypothetical protein